VSSPGTPIISGIAATDQEYIIPVGTLRHDEFYTFMVKSDGNDYLSYNTTNPQAETPSDTTEGINTGSHYKSQKIDSFSAISNNTTSATMT
jgi:hypothetical protein